VSMRAWLATANEEALREVQAVMDRHAHIAPEATEQAISKAIGEELRGAREAAGWSRAQLCARLPSGIGDRTLLSYEHGVRNLTVLRLIELSIALDVCASMVMANGLQRARLHLEHMTLRVVLRDLIADESMTFRSMRQ
jgi:helix-turn-helix protein